MKRILSCFLIYIFIGLLTLSSAAFSQGSAKNLRNTLLNQTYGLKPKLLDNAIEMYQCAEKKGITKKKYLGIIDFTLPSNKKRLWIFDINKKKLLYHTWVAHGKGSGVLYARKFSNLSGSHASSLGLYLTGEIYTGKHGHSLHLRGKEKGFNDRAYERYIVIHGAWYVSKNFVRKYGRIGRSFGCPAVTENITQSIINIIKNGSVLIAYYPEKTWINTSKFLDCK